MAETVSSTLEYAWSDYAIALLAKELGYADDAATFGKHAQSYKNLWNPATQFFQPKDSQGNFQKEEDFRPLLQTYVDFGRKYTRDYVEGSAMQWRWAVPFDAEGLISLFKSREFFVSELENYMANSTPVVGAFNPGGYYWHGNEPYIHAAYLFNDAGRPDLTQKWVRWILNTKYADDYVGLDGNDDGGTLSSWYVFSALGFYPVAGTTKYWIGAPLFDKAEVRIGGKLLTVIAENNTPENMYVQKVWLNDILLERTWFTHDEIAQGGTLRFEMGPTP
jgi:predicted alpha-1,2-mannosidase